MGSGFDLTALMETFTEAVETGAVDDTYSLSSTDLGGTYVFDNMYVETLDDYGWPLTWEIYVKSYSSTSFDELNADDREMGVTAQILEEGTDLNRFRIYQPTFDSTEPSFSDPTHDSDGVTFTATVDWQQNLGLKAKFGGSSSDFDTLFKQYVAEVAAELYVSTAESAHTFKNIKSTEIDDETFDALEGEEAAQTISVATTYAYES